MVVEVALSIILHPDGQRVLIARRLENVHLAGFWEFPGGKVEEGETAVDCAVREAREEAGLDVTAVRQLMPVMHTYPERTVRLTPVLCQSASEDAKPLSSQEIAWIPYLELPDVAFPEANRAIVEELNKELEARLLD